MLGFQHFGTFLLLAAFALLLATCLTTPIGGPDHDFSIAKATVTDEVLSFIKVRSHIKFGVFGFCYRVIGKTQHCSASQLGYELPPLFAILGQVTGYADESAQHSLRSVTKAFVLHPIACGIAFVAFVTSAGSNRLGYLLAAGFDLFAFLVTLATVIVDIVFFHIAKNRIESESDRLTVSVSFSTGTWLTVAALVCEFVAFFIVGCVCFSARRKRGKTEKE